MKTNQLILLFLACLLLFFGGPPPVTADDTPTEDEKTVEKEDDDKDESGGDDEAAEEPAATDSRTNALIAGLTVFVLAIFIGFEVITKVPPTLHTPLMSGSNAISGITVVGAVTVAGFAFTSSSVVFAAIVGMIAVALATINAVGGFLVTHRMLSMFKKR